MDDQHTQEVEEAQALFFQGVGVIIVRRFGWFWRFGGRRGREGAVCRFSMQELQGFRL